MTLCAFLDTEVLAEILFAVECLAWACATVFSLAVLALRPSLVSRVAVDGSEWIKKDLHGEWFEIAGIIDPVDRMLRTALNPDPSKRNLCLQFIRTRRETLDFAMCASSNMEAGSTHQNMFGWGGCNAKTNILLFGVPIMSGRLSLVVPIILLHMNKTKRIMLCTSPTNRNVLYVFSKDLQPKQKDMIPILQEVVGLGYTLQNLKAVVRGEPRPRSSALSSVRRYGILRTEETEVSTRLAVSSVIRGVSEQDASRHQDPAHGQHRRTEQLKPSGPGVLPVSFTPRGHKPILCVDPCVFRKATSPDHKAHSFGKFFDGCVRGDQRFVADFVEREFLWVVARHQRSLWSGLHYAAYNGNVELVAFFLRNKADARAHSIRGETPLMTAIVGAVRHIEERIRWVSGTSCVFDLAEGDKYYSHKPHSLERYAETIRILLRYDSCPSRHQNHLGYDPSQVLQVALRKLDPALKLHPHLSVYVHKQTWRVQNRLRWASMFNTPSIRLDTDLKRAWGLLLWVTVHIGTGLLRYFLKFLEAFVLAIVLLGLGFFYWCIFQTAGHLLIRARIWVPLEARQRAAQTFSGDCALLIVLTVDSPVVTKFAQLLSGRVDLIPQAVADRLAFLQSRAPPMSPQEVEAALCRCYGEDRSHLFASFDMRPLAVGTVAQVHRAHLASSGEPVAVKIVKRSMRKGLDRYLFLLRTLSRLGVFGRSKVARLRVEHVTMMFRQQTDLNLEAASMQAMQREALRHRVRQEDRCHVPDFPQAYSLFTMENILVMDLIDDCVSLQDFLAKPSVPVKVMLARVGRIFYRSVMMDGLLHCDMHPGNIMVRPEDGRIVLLDFGLVGELTESERVALVAFHLASVSNEFVFAAEIFAENFVADVDGRLSDEDVRIRCLVSLGPVFGAHFGEFGGWDFVEFSVDLERVLKEFDVGVTSAWSILQMGIMHFRSTLALLQREGALRDVFLPFLLAEYDVLLGTLVGTKYHSKLEALVHRKFGWSLLFKSDRKLRAEQVYFEEGCK